MNTVEDIATTLLIPRTHSNGASTSLNHLRLVKAIATSYISDGPSAAPITKKTCFVDPNMIFSNFFIKNITIFHDFSTIFEIFLEKNYKS